MLIQQKAYARAGLVGNPSDGYFGKTISFIIRDFCAEVTLFESPELHIQQNERDESTFDSIEELARKVRQFGYYGGIRLLKACVKRFFDYCTKNKIELHGRNFTLRYNSNVPPQVGMAGSSAIITACWRALTEFYGVEIPKHLIPSLVLSVENDELGIPAGLQDRVIQTYEGVVFMDFNAPKLRNLATASMRNSPWRCYHRSLWPTPRNSARAPRSFTMTSVVGGSEETARWVSAMYQWANLAQRVRDMLKAGEGAPHRAALE